MLTLLGPLLWISIFGGTQPAAAIPEAPPVDEVEVLIEISAGSIAKYEIDPCTRAIHLDRFLSMPVTYPANYGFIPGTRAGDGDPLDALVFTREPLLPGVTLNVRVVGVLRMIDGGEEDDKLITVPSSAVDPTWDGIRSIDDLPRLESDRVEAFFRTYKDLPPGGKVVELGGFGGPAEALALLEDAVERGTAEPLCAADSAPAI